MKVLIALISVTLAVAACTSTPSGRDPASEIVQTETTDNTKGKAASATPVKSAEPDCRPFTKGDIKAGASFQLTGTLELNPIAVEALKANKKEMNPAQLKEIQNVMYVLVPDKAPYVGFFGRTETQACRPKKFTLSLESAKELSKAQAAFDKQTKITVRGRATWPESSVELINNGMVGAARIL